MSAKNHKDFPQEQKHLTDTLKWVENERDFLQDYEELLQSEIADLRKSVNSLMDERLILKLQLHETTKNDIHRFKNVEDHPYFGRVDFQEEGSKEVETIYIGKYGVHDQDKEEALIIDWRAPIADIYYSGHSKDVSYHSPIGKISGFMHLKRRYEIQNKELKEIYDEKSSEDRIEESLDTKKSEFLIEALNKSTKGRLKEIVATIQDQQNKIIRSEMLIPLVVQGVAGSGKTTIALHRMAYLIYNNRRNTEANYMVIAPNKLFLNYISDILPDLGVDHVYQTTFEDWCLKLLDTGVSIEETSDQLNQIMAYKEEATGQLLIGIGKLKGSLALKAAIDSKLMSLEKSILLDENITAEDGTLLLSSDEIKKVFLSSNVHLPLQQRIIKLRDYLKIRIKNDFPMIESHLKVQYDKKISKIKESDMDMKKIQQQVIALYDERDHHVKRIQQSIPSIIDHYIDKLQVMDIFTFYKMIFDPFLLAEHWSSKDGTKEDLETLCPPIFEKLSHQLYENQDLTPLVYIHIKLFGLEEKNKYSHIVVDEAQDLNEFQMSLLRILSINDSFTFVGDLSQGIYSYRGINNWTQTMESVFGEKKYHYHMITTSYRSTIEIVELSNEIIKKCTDLNPILSEPVIRHGKKPTIKKCAGNDQMLYQIVSDINHLQKEGLYSIAIICKDLKEANDLYTHMRDQIKDLHLITDEVTTFHGGVVIVPSYLSKGLEFDAVLIFKVDDRSYSLHPLDVKLLYICVTRALHQVIMYYEGNPSPILDGMEKLLYH